MLLMHRPLRAVTDLTSEKPVICCRASKPGVRSRAFRSNDSNVPSSSPHEAVVKADTGLPQGQGQTLGPQSFGVQETSSASSNAVATDHDYISDDAAQQSRFMGMEAAEADSALPPADALSRDAASLPVMRRPSLPFALVAALIILIYEYIVSSSKAPGPEPTKSAVGPHLDYTNRHAKPTARRATTAAGVSGPIGTSSKLQSDPFPTSVGVGRSQQLASEARTAAAKAGAAAAKARGAAARSQAASAEPGKQTVPGQAPAAAAGTGTGMAPNPGPAQAAAVTGGTEGVLDSWSSGGFASSDEESEQQAKAMVMELLMHPKDTEEALLKQAAGGGSGRSPVGSMNISPEYIDALVKAATEPSIGMPHHGSRESRPDGSSAANTGIGPAAGAAAPDAPPTQQQGVGKQQSAGSAQQQGQSAASARQSSMWDWLAPSPRSSQEEF